MSIARRARALTAPALTLLCLIAAAPVSAAVGDRYAVPLSMPQSGPAGADPAYFVGASTDGSHVIFSTTERLVARDTDDVTDYYDRTGGTLRLITGPGDGASGEPQPVSGVQDVRPAITPDGRHVAFVTRESLTGADDDGGEPDLYVADDGVPRLISVQQGFGFYFSDFYLRIRMNADASQVLFTTDSQVAGDFDFNQDTYRYSEGAVAQVVASSADVTLVGATPDVQTAIVETTSDLAADGDPGSDVYSIQDGEQPQLRSPGTEDLQQAVTSGDGSTVVFTTGDPVLAQDTDTAADIYAHDGATLRLVSVPPGPPTDDGAGFQAVNDDGTRIFFTTLEPMTADDDDGSEAPLEDIFERHGDTTTLVSQGSGAPTFQGAFGHHFARISPDGLNVFFDSRDTWPGDPDPGAQDAFVRSAGATTRLSFAQSDDGQPYDVSFAGASSNLSRAFFQTDGRFAADDDDDADDLYERVGGQTRLVSPPEAGACELPSFLCGPTWHGNADDGLRVWFSSQQRLSAQDGDDESDLYESRVAQTPAMSIGGSPTLDLTEGDGAAAIAPALTLDDAYDELFSARVHASGGFDPATDQLEAATVPDGITVTTDDGGATLRFSGRASEADYLTALRAVTFATADDDPSADRAIEIEVDDLGATASVTRTIRIAAVDDRPRLDGAPNSRTYTEQAAATVLAPGVDVTDPDSAQLSGASARIVAGRQSGDELVAAPPAGITATPLADGSGVTFSGAASPAAYAAALRSVGFRNAGDDPGTAQRSVALEVTAEGLASETDVVAVTVLAVNDAPRVTLAEPAGTVPVDGAGVPLDPGAEVADPDSTTLQEATVRIASGFTPADTLEVTAPGSLTVTRSGPVLRLSGAAGPGAYTAALRSVRFSTTAGFGARVIEVTARDGQDTGLPAVRAFATGLAPVLAIPDHRRPLSVKVGGASVKLVDRIAHIPCSVDRGSIETCRVVALRRGSRKRVVLGAGFTRAGADGLRSLRVVFQLNDRGLRELRRRGGRLSVSLAAQVNPRGSERIVSGKGRAVLVRR